jgi:hypothetical protein
MIAPQKSRIPPMNPRRANCPNYLSFFRNPFRVLLAGMLAVLALGGTSSATAGEKNFAPLVVEPTPRHQWSVSLETAQTFNIDHNPNRYIFLLQMVSLDWEPFAPLDWGPVRFRGQLRSTFFASAILQGPESVYLGWGPQARIFVSLGDSPFSWFAGGGAGMGWADASPSNKEDKGLGQQFTFILLASTGVRYEISDRWAVWAGFIWHHLSNGNASEPNKENIGPDEIGVISGISVSF